MNYAVFDIECCKAPAWRDIGSLAVPAKSNPPWTIFAGTDGEYVEDSVELIDAMRSIWRCSNCYSLFITSRDPKADPREETFA
jgi:hypothetical protein